MTSRKNSDVMLMGALLRGFLRACGDLSIELNGGDAYSLRNIKADRWYPLSQLQDLERAVASKRRKNDNALEKIGASMMQSWYQEGPGKEIISRGLEFLFFQSSSKGYRSVVKGPEELVGSFTLIGFDERKGAALIRSTTPFNKDMERGIIIGGMSAPGDLVKIEVNNDKNPELFFIEFE